MMERSRRLADLLQIVRDGRLHLARDIADALEVSVRTVYRDIGTLVAAGVPIDGERGVGYLLREPVFLPPMSLSLTELEALSLGMAIVREAADEELQAAAASVMAKVGEHASNRRQIPKSWGFGVYAFEKAREGFRHMPLIRRAIRERLKLRIDYASLDDKTTSRIIRPLQTEYWGRVWTCSAWCELRNEFRAFRIDRMQVCEATGKLFQPEPGKTIEDYLKYVAEKWIEIETVHRFITEQIDGVAPKDAWGETSYFYNPGHVFERGTYFATIKQKDGENDRASHLYRDGVWRLNMGVSKSVFADLFGPPPARPCAGRVIHSDFDFAALDLLTPHPVYGWMSWVSVLNPSTSTWDRCVPLLKDAHERARAKFRQRQAKVDD